MAENTKKDYNISDEDLKLVEQTERNPLKHAFLRAVKGVKNSELLPSLALAIPLGVAATMGVDALIGAETLKTMFLGEAFSPLLGTAVGTTAYVGISHGSAIVAHEWIRNGYEHGRQGYKAALEHNHQLAKAQEKITEFVTSHDSGVTLPETLQIGAASASLPESAPLNTADVRSPGPESFQFDWDAPKLNPVVQNILQERAAGQTNLSWQQRAELAAAQEKQAQQSI
jgi:hypothetical protein